MKNVLTFGRIYMELLIVSIIAYFLVANFSTVESPLLMLTLFVSIIGALFIVGSQSGRANETISITEVRGAVTNTMIDFYQERPQVKSFLRSFFPSTTANTKLISIEVERGTEKLAVDIIRGTGSRHNKNTRSTVNTILPPYYSEEFNINELAIYDSAYGTLNVGQLRNLAAEQMELAAKVIDKVERSYEKQCADVLQTGIATFAEHESIDFRRKASSMVNNPAQYWDNPANDWHLPFENAGKFLREQGKIQTAKGSAYVVILGGKALTSLFSNDDFREERDLRHMDLGTIIPAEMGVDGASYHGRLSVGNYLFDLWSYPEVYEDANGNIVSYIDEKNMIVTTYSPRFKFVYGMVPQLPGIVSPLTMKQGFYTLEYIDPKMMNHAQRIMSAGLAVPVAVDQVYTQQVTS